MSNELMLFGSGDMKPRNKFEREQAQEGMRILLEVRKKAAMARGAIAVSSDAMEGMTNLHKKQQQLAGPDDPALDMLLGDIKMTALRKVSGIIDSLYDPFNL